MPILGPGQTKLCCLPLAFRLDVKSLQKVLKSRHLIYQHQHNKQMSCPPMAQSLSNTLYFKRFLPYYALNVLGGLDKDDERVGYGAQGSSSTLIMPFLDNQLKLPSPILLPKQDSRTPLSETEAVDLVKTVFASATERGIYTGDDGNFLNYTVCSFTLILT